MTSPDIQHIIRRLAERLQAASYGDLVTYDDMSQAIGQNVRMQQVRPLIYRALKLTAVETGAVFKNVNRKGFCRLHPTELPRIGLAARTRIRRQAGRSSKLLSMGSRLVNEMPPDVQQAILREQSVLGLIQTLAQDRNLPRMPQGQVQPLTAAQTAERFLEGIGAARKKAGDGST